MNLVVLHEQLNKGNACNGLKDYVSLSVCYRQVPDALFEVGSLEEAEILGSVFADKYREEAKKLYESLREFRDELASDQLASSLLVGAKES